VNYFSVPVNTSNPYLSTNEIIENDYCVLMLPNITTPAKLVLFCHGSGEPVYANSSSLDNNSKKLPAALFCACGYAVLCVNGLPKTYSDRNGLSYGRPVGNWMAIESSIRAVDYVIDNYNISQSGIYVYGESQGGMTAMNFIENSSHKINACVLDSPAISMKYHQLNISGALTNLKHFYGFNNISEYNENAVQGLDPYARNTTHVEDASSFLLNGNELAEGEEMKITSVRFSKTPIKFFLGKTDISTRAYVSQIVAKQLKNSGQFVSLSLYNIGHCVGQNSPTIGRVLVDNKEYQVTQPMVDMIDWFLRFGGNNMISLI
jgi:predicted esterase